MAISVFFASAAGTRDLQHQILHTDLLSPYSDLDKCRQLWHDHYSQVQSSPVKQQTWDKPIEERELSQLMECQTENYDMARLLASASKHSGNWLHTVLISFCGLRMDDEAIRIAMELRLDLDIWEPHICVCDAMVDIGWSHA